MGIGKRTAPGNALQDIVFLPFCVMAVNCFGN